MSRALGPGLSEDGTLDGDPSAFSRRDALRLLALGISSGLAACSKPVEEIVPYVRMPERIVPGEPLVFATTLPLSGYGRGVMVTSMEGRPIKVEGNPRHPASLGATDVFAEASVLSLYDPDRSQSVLHEGEIASWDQFDRALLEERRRLDATAGEGLRILTGRITSPTSARRIANLLRRWPKARWHAYEPVDDEAERAGARLAFGRSLLAVPHLDRVEIVVAIGADPLGHGPDQLRLARSYADGRRGAAATISRLYVIESAPTLTGAKADHRLALPPDALGEALLGVANALGAGLRNAELPDAARKVVAAAAADLQAHPGRALVLCGPSQSPQTHALACWINGKLAAPVDLIEPVDVIDGQAPNSMADLARDLEARTVDSLVVLGANPAYDAPADLDFPGRMKRARLRVHAGSYADETAALSHWHLPLSHPLESWADLRSLDGTASIAQPLIRPLYATRTLDEVVALVAEESSAGAYDLVRDTWRPVGGADFEGWWTQALHDGVVPGGAAAAVARPPATLPTIGAARAVSDADRLAIVLRPDPSLWDGRFANNAWLQELPKPLTKQVWGNGLAIGEADARGLGLAAGDVVSVSAGERSLEATILVVPGHATGTASLTLGYGRSRAGAIGTGIGINAYGLRSSDSPWLIRDATLKRTGRREDVLTTQNVVRGNDAHQLYPMLALRDFAAGHAPRLGPGPLPTLLPERPKPAAEHAWGMVIDTSVCIGCNACTIACQAENNVPVVGPEEIARGRQMHWIRVDTYDHGAGDTPKLGFQPVPCMQCEHAPCEPVCPVAASVHDGEGLNVQIYNRCVGTRFCEANCPYKVRRFNFFGYADGQEYANLGLESYKAQKNPDVTVRARGVMEKCTYCVQRISRARRASERDDRPIGPDEVKTACQSACPTRAITFGDLAQPSSAVNRLKADERHYALLGHLGTRPRTTYLADVENRSADLGGDHS